MSGEEEGAEKSFDPTPRKLEEARKRGEIVRSQDLNTAVVYGGLLIGTALFGPMLADRIGGVAQVLLGQADTIAPLMLSPGGSAPAGGVIGAVFAALAGLIAVPAGLLIAALMAQNAILFTPSKLQPKLSRISPIQNAKQKFGASGLFEFAKSGTKLAIYTVLLALFLIGRRDQILGAMQGSGGQVLAAMGRQSRDFLVFVLIVALVVGGTDYLWQWGEHLRRNRMTRKEIADESKESEGDPHLKQERRQRGYDIATNRMISQVPEAAVVIVNPTHYAVALKWDRKKGEVPVCVAKGVDEVARRIRETAIEAGVPIYSDPPTARLLHGAVDLGAPIERDHFRAVAAAIRFADAMRRKAGRRR
ncbi:flagellar type III secretion system protein FlhB [Rhodobacterales bacterium HKCCE2091]|nr:flagellar type III secretion system protein FlhB [Rhodobacterales bacterium HKCCE2091]